MAQVAMTVSRRFRRLTLTLAAVALVATACGKGDPRLPAPGAVDADKFLFDKGTAYLKDKNWITAREYFKRLIDSFPSSPYRYEAKLGIGDSYLGEGRIDSVILAVNEFREYKQYFPLNPRADYADYKICLGSSKQMLSPQRDQTATIEAIKECDAFLKAHPGSPYQAEVGKLYRAARDRLSQSEYEVGLTYFRFKNYEGAMGRWAALLKTDPEFTRRDAVYFHMAEVLAKGGRPAEALPLYSMVVTDFPKSDFVKKAQSRIAELKRSSGRALPVPPKAVR